MRRAPKKADRRIEPGSTETSGEWSAVVEAGSDKPFDAGTKVIITFDPRGSFTSDIVKTHSGVRLGRDLDLCLYLPDAPHQHVDIPGDRANDQIFYPIRWMRKYEDPDGRITSYLSTVGRDITEDIT